jgi:hypothetical protein
MLGDMDNFGYGGNDTPPCAYFDLSEPVDDLGIFDREFSNSGDHVVSWTHDFSSDAGCVGFDAAVVTIEIREFFSQSTQSTISFDGVTVPFAEQPFALCDSAIIRTFTFTGSDADFADDGIITIVFMENNDDICFDWARVTVQSYCDADGDGVYDEDDNCLTSSPETTVKLAGCDSGVPNLQISNGCNMVDLILECAENAVNQGAFMRCVSDYTNTWRQQGLITVQQRKAIKDCAADYPL